MLTLLCKTDEELRELVEETSAIELSLSEEP
jgi:hypothetical protein